MSTHRNQALPSSKKTHSERHKHILRQLCKEVANKSCADCKTAAHPRWASWNLGCFVCIRCSGIHRSMGTHISKVKLVDLDAWTDEQVELMVKWGNGKCNLYWEAKLPDGYVPDQLKIENFIRTKYDLRKWAASPQIPDPLKMAGPPSVSDTQQHPAISALDPKTATHKAHHASASPVAANSSQPPQNNSASLLDDFGSFVSSKPPTNNTSLALTPRATPATLSLVSLPARPASASASLAPPTRVNDRPDLKKSILSLYSSPSSSTPSLSNQPYSLSNSLSGLNLSATQKPVRASTANSSFSEAPKQQRQAPQATQNSTNTALEGWGNEWDSAWKPGANSGAAALNNALDEDLFRNVWKS